MEITDLRWFALKVFYNKVFDIEDTLKGDGIESYIPMTSVMIERNGVENGVEYIGEDNPRYHKGDLVKVIDGPFKGSEGHIVRIKNDHRLVVTVKGICAVATSYIPRCFLQKVEETD